MFAIINSLAIYFAYKQCIRDAGQKQVLQSSGIHLERRMYQPYNKAYGKQFEKTPKGI